MVLITYLLKKQVQFLVLFRYYNLIQVLSKALILLYIIILVLWIGLVLSCSTEKELGIVPVFLASTLLIPFLYILGM